MVRGKPRVLSGERVRAEFRQSSFAGTPIFARPVRKRSQEFVSRSQRGLPDRWPRARPDAAKALARRDRESTLAEYPIRLKSGTAALSERRPSERYSK